MASKAEPRSVGRAEIHRALRALRTLGKDPNRTDAVGLYIAALTGSSAATLYAKVWRDPTGRRLLEERRDLSATLSDRTYLAALPEGSLGRVYFDWTEAREFTAEGIAQAISAQVGRVLDSPEATFAARIVDMHDLWHVVNGWDTDLYGELHLLGYSYAQLGAYAWLSLAVLFNLVLVSTGRFAGIAYLNDSIRRGRKAKVLAAVEWEALLPLPLDEVRHRLDIEEPQPYERLPFASFHEIQKTSPVLRALRAVLPP